MSSPTSTANAEFEHLLGDFGKAATHSSPASHRPAGAHKRRRFVVQLSNRDMREAGTIADQPRTTATPVVAWRRET